MITVSIFINGAPIISRSACNRGPDNKEPGQTRYEMDDGSWLLHKREDGAIELAKQMLDRVKELK